MDTERAARPRYWIKSTLVAGFGPTTATVGSSMNQISFTELGRLIRRAGQSFGSSSASIFLLPSKLIYLLSCLCAVLLAVWIYCRRKRRRRRRWTLTKRPSLFVATLRLFACSKLPAFPKRHQNLLTCAPETNQLNCPKQTDLSPCSCPATRRSGRSPTTSSR